MHTNIRFRRAIFALLFLEIFKDYPYTVAEKNRCLEKTNGAPYTETTKAERTRKMNDFKKIMDTSNVNLKGLIVEKSPNSPLITTRREMYVPEKKIILMDQISEQESQFIKSITKSKGGLIV